MVKTKKSNCMNCGFVKPKFAKNPEEEKKCHLCDETYKLKDANEHKNKELHKLKSNLLKQIRKLDAKDNNDKETIDKITKTLTPKFKKVNDKNKNVVE